MKIKEENIQKFINVMSRFLSFEGSLFRYSLAFSFLLALFPTLIIIVMLFHFSYLNISSLLTFLYRFFSEDFLRPFVEYIMKQSYDSTLSIFISVVTGFHFASRSLYSFMLISAKDENFNVPKILIRIKSYFLFAFLVVCVTILALLTTIFQYSVLLTFLIGLFFIFLIMYKTLTFEKRPWSFGIAGALFSTISTILFSWLFLELLDYFTSYDTLYGPMAGLVGVMLSIYVVSSIVFFGYCINIVYGASYDKRTFKREAYYMFGKRKIDQLLSIIKGVLK